MGGKESKQTNKPWFQNMANQAITFQGSRASGPIHFSFEKYHFDKKYSSYMDLNNKW